MYTQNGVIVVQEASPKDSIQRELKKIDRRLFVQLQIGLDNKQVWCVVVEGDPPATVLEWRDDTGEPIPYLTDRVFDRIAAMERSDGKITEYAIEQNRKLIERKQKESDEYVAEVFREMIPMVNGRKRILAPRGQKLYQQRNRRRARGEL